MDKKAVIGTFSVGSSFRLACGNPSIPAHNHITALNRAPAVLHLSVRVGYNRRSLFAGALAGFPARVPARSHLTALNRAPAVLHLSVRVGYNRPLLPAYTCGENPLYFSYEKNLYRKP